MTGFVISRGTVEYFPEEVYDSREAGEWHLVWINSHKVSAIYWNWDGSYSNHALFSTKEQALAYIANEENGLLRQLD